MPAACHSSAVGEVAKRFACIRRDVLTPHPSAFGCHLPLKGKASLLFLSPSPAGRADFMNYNGRNIETEAPSVDDMWKGWKEKTGSFGFF